ncbi:uncharacterized protein FYW49_015443 [Xenentodon cancila]
MSDLPVQDHLAGILSDFEALKKSFDAEDTDDIPAPSGSPMSSSISHSSFHPFPNHDKATEKQGEDGQSSSSVFDNSVGSTPHSAIHLSSSPSRALKTRTLSSSLSFSRVTENKPVIHNKGSSVVRAVSFQSRLNSGSPNFCSSPSGPGSDNDSLRSSTSSLEYSGGRGYTMPVKTVASYHSPPPLREYHGGQLQHQQHLKANMKKCSSHISVCKSEIKQEQGMMHGIGEPQEMNHGFMSIMDFQTANEEVGKMEIPHMALSL